MKKWHVILAVVVLVVGALVVTFIRNYVPVTELSGSFVSANDSTVRLVFEGRNVSLYEGVTQIQNGTYRIAGRDTDFLVIVFNDEELRFWLRDNKNTIHYNVMDGNIVNVGEVAFVRE